MLAYSVDAVGDERYTLRFKDLRTGSCSRTKLRDIRRCHWSPMVARSLSDGRRLLAARHCVAGNAGTAKDDDVKVFTSRTSGTFGGAGHRS